MAGKKGAKHYPLEVRAKVVSEYLDGASVHSLSRKHKISRFAIRTWCGLVKGKGSLIAPTHRDCPQKTLRKHEQKLDVRIKELEREVELLRSFLHAAGRM